MKRYLCIFNMLLVFMLAATSGAYAYTITPSATIDPDPDPTIDNNWYPVNYAITLDNNEILTSATLSVYLYDGVANGSAGATHIKIDGTNEPQLTITATQANPLIQNYDVLAALADNTLTLNLQRHDGPDSDYNFDKAILSITTTVIPIPTTLLLLGTGLLGLGAVGLRRRKKI
jgi:hypothetical protein